MVAVKKDMPFFKSRCALGRAGRLLPRVLPRVLAVALVMLVVCGADSLAAAGQTPSFFNSREVSSTNLEPFKKWTQALDRYSKESAKKNGGCGEKELNKCTYLKWMKFLQDVKSKSKHEQIDAVNKYMNRARYVTDKNNWGQKDYWATPGEFMARFGDCEDYAISKFMSLKHLGFTEDDMRVVAVKDLNLKVGHAILVVFIEGKTYVLDNQIKTVVDATKVRHYEPIFSINSKMWWRHSRG